MITIEALFGQGRRIFNRPILKIIAIASSILVLLIFFNLSAVSSSITGNHEAGSQFAISESNSTKLSKAIIASVMRKHEEGTDWIVDMLPGWEPHIYMADGTIDDVQALSEQHAKKTPLAFNRGREASAYLTYLINHYYNLPDYMVFVHGERYQIHNGEWPCATIMYDTYPLINNLDLNYVDSEGYANLRCNWKQCPEPYIVPVLGHEDTIWEAHGDYADAWQTIFPNETMPDKVGAPCCAQFAVNRQTVHRWPVAKYEQIRAWMWARGDGLSSMKSGIIMEYMWHIIFGKPAFWCPPVRECYCGTWNMCNLDCDDEKGWCKGRIWATDPPLSFPWPIEGWEKDLEISGEH
ncbi:hypothetical protein D6D00_04931 [Aureobasidium pullulans]|nr:hypothetical protein D6D00_04931 [Aureobasidium pullulans]